MPEQPILSTQNLSALPPPEDLARLSQSLAVLDAALMPQWEYRYYSFNARWSNAEQMASMRNGSGDNYFLWLSQKGAVLKSFAHESAVWQQLCGIGADHREHGVQLPIVAVEQVAYRCERGVDRLEELASPLRGYNGTSWRTEGRA